MRFGTGGFTPTVRLWVRPQAASFNGEPKATAFLDIRHACHADAFGLPLNNENPACYRAKRVPGYMDREKETRQLSDAYILLRNALYFGHAEKVLPLAEQLTPKVAAMAQAVKRDAYQPVNARAVDPLHKKAMALNDFDLITALTDNMK